MAIRSSRRGALLAGLLLWPLVLLAAITTPGAFEVDLRRVVLVAALSWPGLALLGAGLAPAALGSRIDATVAGIALALGAPIAAIMSTLIGVAIIASISSTGAGVGEALGMTIRLGVMGALRWAPLLVIVVVVWLVVVRKTENRSTS